MRFVWDQEKNRRNIAKHNVSFELAMLVFEDPHQLSVVDVHEGEERWQTLGLVGAAVILLVVHTVKEEKDGEEEIRIISARKATRVERKAYEDAR